MSIKEIENPVVTIWPNSGMKTCLHFFPDWKTNGFHYKVYILKTEDSLYNNLPKSAR